MRTLTPIAIALAAAAATTSALADGPQVGTTVNSAQSRDGHMLYVANARGNTTRLRRFVDGRPVRTVWLHGWLRFPVVAQDLTSEGLSHDGRTLLLASQSGRFGVVDARTLRLRFATRLGRSFTYDALSPHARSLYLIQHVPSRFSSRYYVRVYDVPHHRLLPRPIFDTREKWSLMGGFPLMRATTGDGRWVYTLYTRPGGKPFVHSLDSIHRKAVCVDLPWMRDQSRLYEMSLQLSGDERTLLLRDGGRIFRRIDTRTFRVS